MVVNVHIGFAFLEVSLSPLIMHFNLIFCKILLGFTSVALYVPWFHSLKSSIGYVLYENIRVLTGDTNEKHI